jgi:hypothetical protein
LLTDKKLLDAPTAEAKMLPDDIQIQFDPPELQSRANPYESENSKQNYFHSIKIFLQVDYREDIFIESLAVPFA